MMAWQWHRPLGRSETVMALLHHSCQGSTQFCLGLTIDRPPGMAAVRQAARHVHARFALLRCAIEERAGALWFREQDGGACGMEPEVRGGDGIEQKLNTLMDAEVLDPLDMRRSLWRLAYARTADHAHLVLTFQHAAVDAEGAMKVAAALLGSLDELMARGDIEDQPGRVLPGAIDSFPQTIDPSSNGVPVLAARQAGARSTAVHRSRVSAACWSAFHEACAYHGVLPNAVLSAALMLAMQESGQERPGMRFRCAVSLKRQAQGNGALLGTCVGVADAEPCPAGSALLDAAKDHQVKLVVSMSRGLSHAEPWTLNGLAEGLWAQCDHMGGYGVSNIGQPDLRTRWGHFDVTDISSATNRSAGNNHVGLNVLLFRGELHLYYCYPSHLVRQVDVVRIDGVLRGYIESLSLAAVAPYQS